MLSFANPHGDRRVRIGVTNTDGNRATLILVRDDTSPSRRLIPTLPEGINTGAETDGSDAGPAIPVEHDPWATRLPTEDDITMEYLRRHDWLLVDGVPRSQWIDPLTEEAVDYLTACARQDERDTRDYLAECQPPEPSRSELTVGFDHPDGTSTIRPFVSEDSGAPAASAHTEPQPPKIGIAYYAGRTQPHRAYCEKNGVRKWLGYFKLEADAWNAATQAAQL